MSAVALPRGRLRPVLRGTGTVFIVAGLTVLFFLLYLIVGTAQVEHRHQTQLQKEFQQELLNTPCTHTPPAPGHAIGRIIVPAMHVNMIFVEGIDLSDLQYGPGHYPETPLPGQKGSVAIAGHRTGWGSPFIDFDKIKPGDLITLITTCGKFVYQVRALKQVEKTDVWVLDGEPGDKSPYRLVLTTCTPKYTSLHRLVAWADQISPTPGKAKA